MSIIEVENLSKYFPPPRRGFLGLKNVCAHVRANTENKIVALNDLSFSIEKGEWFGIVGPNGAGKTTLLDILMDIVTPSSGHIYIDGHDTNLHHRRVKGKICCMERWSFESRIKVRTLLCKAATEWRSYNLEIGKTIIKLAESFGMVDKLDDWLIRLSAGMQRKVMLMASLMSSASILVFDEATLGFDVSTRRELYDQLNLQRESRGRTVVWTTHNLDEAQKVCSRIAVIKNDLIALGAPAQLIGQTGCEDFESAFVTLITTGKRR